jgi:hypothetical protein
MRRWAPLVLVFAFAASMAYAAPRTWTSSNGRFRIDAELLDFKDGKACLRRADGGLVEVPLVSLCDDDRAFVKRQYPGVEEEQFRPGVEYRQWKSKGGNFSLAAEFVAVAEGRVQLRKADGTELAVELAKLSIEDQRWVRDELRRQREEDQEAAAGAAGAAKKAVEEVGKLDQQTVSMKLVRLDPPKGRGRSKGKKTGVPAEFFLRLTEPLSFYMQLGGRGMRSDEGFRGTVRKEPSYAAPAPFRGVAGLGGYEYAFALDSDGKQAAAYNKLYFDANHNGDLTDDKPIAAAETNAPPGGGMMQSQFPRVDVSLGDSSSPDYSFLLGTLCRSALGEAYASVSIYSAAIREGYITQGRRKTHLVLVDHNSNGRFNDPISLRSNMGRLRPESGDLLLINPDTRDTLAGDATAGRDRCFVSKTVCIGKDFYQLEVSPSGDTLKLTPTELALGYVNNPSPAYRAMVYSDTYGAMMIGGMKDQKIPLPEGEWRVASYTIDATGFAGRARTAVSASFRGESPATSVQKGQTAKLAFGAPFRGLVSGNRTNNGVSLSLSIVGAAGEYCTSFYVNGSRPPAPLFVIKDRSGKTVHQGRFEWG